MKKMILLAAAVMVMAGSSCSGKSAKAQDGEPAAAAATAQPRSDENAPTATADAGKSVVKTIDASLTGADILPAITKNYAGKVVLIDFWATWCGPCRAAMKSIDEIKPALEKKGCVFVYVTGETSPEADWKKMVPTIAGDHYRVTDAQWNDLCSQLGIPGIPAYMLLNKDGSVAFSNLNTGGYPGSDVLQNNIEVALTK